MVNRFFEFHSPECDCCGATMAAEHSDEAAEASMRAAGWERMDGKDVCPLCQRKARESGRLPERRKHYKDIQKTGKEDKTMEETNLFEQEEAERTAESDPATLLSDAVRCIRAERGRIEARTGARYNSAYESYSVLIKALEDKSTAEKDLKDAVKKLWEGVRSEDGDVILAFLGKIERVARESAMAWMHVAAICQKAGDSV